MKINRFGLYIEDFAYTRCMVGGTMKKSNVSKLLVLALVLTLTLFITACGNGEKPIETEKFTVIFDVNAGDDNVQNEPDTVRIDSGKTVSKPSPDPIRNGYDFMGWYENADGVGQVYDFNTPVTKNNFVLYAKWAVTIIYHQVTFDYADERADLEVQIADLNAISAPQVPTRTSYRFDGWYMDAAYSSAYNFESRVDSNFTLYAKWIEVVSVTFNFNYEGAENPLVQIIDIDTIPMEPSIPTRENFNFAGWFTDEDLTQPYGFDAANSSVMVYAKWIDSTSSNTFSVEFVFNYEGAPENIVTTVVDGGVIVQPNTLRTNYRFQGWYIDNETFINRFNPSTPVTDDLVLYAKWVRVYQLSYDYNYSGAINPQPSVVDENTPITQPQSPARMGYTFAGWSNASKGLIGYNFQSGIQSDTTVFAQWSKIHVFEAEYLDFSDFFGWGFSGNATGTDAIVADTDGQGAASNGHFVTYLYGKGITLTYDIYSDRAVSDVTLTLRLSGEVKDFFIQSTKTPGVLEQEPVYTIKVNGQSIQYSKIYFVDVPSQSSNTLLPFQDFVISVNISLVEGKNTFQLITDNELLMGGTMSATAPMVDCLKLTTYAVLTWTPKLDNY